MNDRIKQYLEENYISGNGISKTYKTKKSAIISAIYNGIAWHDNTGYLSNGTRIKFKK